MHCMKIKRIIALAALLSVVGLGAFGQINNSPTSQSVEFAKRTSNLLLNEILAALVTEFNETTTENVEEGKQAISLIFNDANRDMRLIGLFPPLLGGHNALPSDAFEVKSLALALKGQPHDNVERVGNRWYYRRSIALSNSLHPACVLCHTNFTPQFFEQTNNPGQGVGALTLRVPIKTEH